MNFPQPFIASLDRVPGLDEPSKLLQSLDEDPPASIRVNPKKFVGDLAHLEPVVWSHHGYYLSSRPSFVADPLFHAGVYYVQESSSMIIGQVIKRLIETYFVDSAIRVLDLCAAPGGKSTDIISNLRETDLLVSNEVVRNRAQILRENVIKWGFPNHLVSTNDPRDFQRLEGYFDIIVVDAPCSGEGMFRKDHAAREEWSPEHVKLCGARQERIIADVWDALSEDGFLVYSTCTFNSEENERVLSFLAERYDAEAVDLQVEGLSSRDTIKRFFPHETRGEGFSYFVVQKRTAQRAVKLPRVKTKKVENLPLSIKHEGRVVEEKDGFVFYSHEQDAAMLSSRLQMIKRGLNLGVMKKNKWVPDPEIAFSTVIDYKIPEIALTLNQAQAYLKCETFDLPTDFRGFQRVSFEGFSLGFINHLGNRFNNYFPSSWRIRTQQILERTAFL